MLLIGIDVGGTNTDAVLMKDATVKEWVKTPTTPDVSSGITKSLQVLLQKSEIPPDQVQAVMIGTTHFTNAVVQRRDLMQTAAIRLGLPATQSLPPMVDWPQELRDAIGNHKYLAHGGHEYDGRPISNLDENELREIARQIQDEGIRSIAVSSVFSPVNSEFEQEAAEILQAEIEGVTVTLSHEIGRIGLLERENAAIMNACLQDLGKKTIRAFRGAVRELNIDAPLYLTQNDGTLMNSEFAEKYPIFTFSSGPTNSMRGAAFLSGLQEAMVVDIGGTTSDVGALTHGFPREASTTVEIGGVRTNFRMPDVYSFGLGGGSLVVDNPLRIGPQSVGYELTQRALVFGGSELTASDIAVAAGLAEFGDRGAVSDLDTTFVDEAVEHLKHIVEQAVDRMKISAEPIPVIVVGGGSILIGEKLKGASEMIMPDHFPVANAVGAAIAQISGEVDRVFALAEMSRDQALEQAKEEARERAISAGADPKTVDVVDVEDVPLTYLPGNATRIRVKAVGDLKLA